jgi:hypothetical protein
LVLINKKRVRSIAPYLYSFPPNAKLRAVRVLETGDDLQRAGFRAGAALGDTILPNAIGPASDFNANGREVVRKDLPKERRYIRTVMWSWTEWHGRYQSIQREEARDIFKDCYPRDFIAPPGCEITLIDLGGKRAVSSPAMAKNDSQSLTNAANLILELFGPCHIIEADAKEIAAVTVRKVNWRMLPPGQHPWKHIEEHVKRAAPTHDGAPDRVIMDRQHTIHKFGPDAVYVGEGGFSRYVAYEFRSRKMVVLECIEFGNALYLLGNNWQAVSKFTKAEVLGAGLHQNRIIHSTGWKTKFGKIMDPPRKAAG